MKEVSLGFEPNPKQIEFFKARAKHVAYGGARGGGKSWAMRTKLIMLATRYKGIQMLLLRRTFPELRENHIIPLLMTLKGIAKYKSQDKVFEFPNGSRIVLGYCSNEIDALQYQGQSYDVIGLEEATQFTEQQYLWIVSSLRPTIAGFSPRMYYTCNPGGVGHTWVKRLFIDRQYRNEEKPSDYHFIPAKVTDNYVLMQRDPDYIRILQNMPEDMRRAHLDGDWDVFAGQYFPEFSRDIHVVEPFPIPREWRKFRTVDYGLDMFACLWVAIDSDRNLYVYRELAQPDLPIPTAAQKAIEMTPRGEEIYCTLAPGDLWGRGQETGRCRADIFAESGLRLVKTSNDRLDGWAAVKKLMIVDDGKAQLRIFKGCNTLISNIPLLQHDEIKKDDVSTDPHDITHVPDALRYIAVWWANPSKVTLIDEYHEPWAKDLLEDYERASPELKEIMRKKYGKPRY